MARSASGARSAVLVVAAAGSAGCATTQQEAARLQLNSARIRTSEAATQVAVGGQGGAGHARGARDAAAARTAFVVQLRNPGRRAVSDLPISVGVRGPHRRRIDVNVLSPAGGLLLRCPPAGDRRRPRP